MPDGSEYNPSQWIRQDYHDLRDSIRVTALRSVIILNAFRDKRIQRALLKNRINYDIYETLYTIPVKELPTLIGKTEIIDDIITFRIKKGK